MANPLALFGAQIVAILSVLLLAVGYLKTEPKAASARVFALMAAFIVLYLLNGMTGPHIDPAFRLDLSRWRLPIALGTNAVSGLFMLYCFLVFQERRRFPRPLAAAFALQVLAEGALAAHALHGALPGLAGAAGWLAAGLDVAQLAFVGCAMYWTLKGWRADLVDDRRILRWFIIGVQGALLFGVVFAENFLLEDGSPGAAAGEAALVHAIAALTLCMLLAALRFDFVSLSHAIRQVAERTEEPAPERIPELDEEGFDRAFRDGGLYREAGLTITMLARRMKIPEYRLRAFIHKRLGFRNFNAMLHRYRIEDACAALADPERRGLPVLTIALSVGYRSITPFNNAFRELKGMTPSEYRKRRQAR